MSNVNDVLSFRPGNMNYPTNALGVTFRVVKFYILEALHGPKGIENIIEKVEKLVITIFFFVNNVFKMFALSFRIRLAKDLISAVSCCFI